MENSTEKHYISRRIKMSDLCTEMEVTYKALKSLANCIEVQDTKEISFTISTSFIATALDTSEEAVIEEITAVINEYISRTKRTLLYNLENRISAYKTGSIPYAY